MFKTWRKSICFVFRRVHAGHSVRHRPMSGPVVTLDAQGNVQDFQGRNLSFNSVQKLHVHKRYIPYPYRIQTSIRAGVVLVKEMDALQMSSCESDPTKVLTSKVYEPSNFRNDSHSVRILEDLQSLHKNEVFKRFEADEDEIVIGQAMFNNFDESNKDLIDIRELDSTILKILVDYIYTGEIMVTKENIQVLLPAANVLQ